MVNSFIFIKQSLVKSFFLFLVSVSYLGHAQISVGGRLGLNVSRIATDRASTGSISLKPGAQIGGVINYAWKGGVSFQGELLFSMKGYKAANESFNGSYIELPALIKIEIPTTKPIKPFVNFGPYFGYQAGSNISYNDTTSKRLNESVFNKNNLNKAEFGLCFGSGVNYPLKKGVIVAEIRYTFALSNLSSATGLDRNRVVGLYFTYLLPITKKKEELNLQQE